MKDKPLLSDLPTVVKNKFLKDQIDMISKIPGIEAISVSVFLLKCQLIEYELKTLIPLINISIREHSRTAYITHSFKMPDDFDSYTFGKLINEVKRYEWQGSGTFIKCLENLNKLRIEFVHKLFSNDYSLKEIQKYSHAGTLLANIVLDDIDKIAIKMNVEILAFRRALLSGKNYPKKE